MTFVMTLTMCALLVLGSGGLECKRGLVKACFLQRKNIINAEMWA